MNAPLFATRCIKLNSCDDRAIHVVSHASAAVTDSEHTVFIPDAHETLLTVDSGSDMATLSFWIFSYAFLHSVQNKHLYFNSQLMECGMCGSFSSILRYILHLLSSVFILKKIIDSLYWEANIMARLQSQLVNAVSQV